MTFFMFGLRSDSARLQAYWNCFIILSPISVQDPLDNIKRCLENFDTGQEHQANMLHKDI